MAKTPRRRIAGRVALNAWIPEDLHEWVRVTAAKRRVPMWEIVAEALMRYREHKEGEERR